jgi:hypothetical protein
MRTLLHAATAFLDHNSEQRVIPGLVLGIQPSADTRVCGTMDPGDKHRDDPSGSLVPRH